MSSIVNQSESMLFGNLGIDRHFDRASTSLAAVRKMEFKTTKQGNQQLRLRARQALIIYFSAIH